LNNDRVRPAIPTDERAFELQIPSKRVLIGGTVYPFAGLIVEPGITLSSARYRIDGGSWVAITTGSYTDLIQAIKYLNVTATTFESKVYELELTDVDSNIVTESTVVVVEIIKGNSKSVDADVGFRPFSDFRIGTQTLSNIQYKVTGASTVALTAITRAVLLSGTHSGSNNASSLTDTTRNFVPYSFEINRDILKNTTDVSEGVLTAIDAYTLTATLAGGTDNDWDTSDAYQVVEGGSLANVAKNFTLTLSTQGYHLVTLVATDGSANTSSASVLVSVN
jgi:hypothetical protein